MLQEQPMPLHWRTPVQTKRFGWLYKAMFNFLCLAAHGQAGMEGVWTAIQLDHAGDESVWDDHVQRLMGRLNNMVVVVCPSLMPSNL